MDHLPCQSSSGYCAILPLSMRDTIWTDSKETIGGKKIKEIQERERESRNKYKIRMNVTEKRREKTAVFVTENNLLETS